MQINKFGAVSVTEQEAFDALYSGKIKDFSNLYLDQSITEQFNQARKLNKDDFNKIQEFFTADHDLTQFDKKFQDQWFMPEDYKSFDIVNYLLKSCKTQIETDRVLEELELFVQHDMINVLNYLKYLVDVMRENNIVWGVGRGSSVASYCLYLIGIHRIDSIRYNLDIREFLK
jgi:DNA polymerase III alpha subunit